MNKNLLFSLVFFILAFAMSGCDKSSSDNFTIPPMPHNKAECPSAADLASGADGQEIESTPNGFAFSMPIPDAGNYRVEIDGNEHVIRGPRGQAAVYRGACQAGGFTWIIVVNGHRMIMSMKKSGDGFDMTLDNGSGPITTHSGRK